MQRPTIAVIGASSSRHKFGNICVRAYAAAGYDVYPVNPQAAIIEGCRVYATVADIPVSHLDRISIYLRAAQCLPLLPELAKKPAREVWFNPGADDPGVLEIARSLGLNAVAGCSIVAIGADPHAIP